MADYLIGETNNVSSSTARHRREWIRRKSMTDTSSKVAIVTGASGGIGAAIAGRLARDGFTVVVNYAGNVAPAEALVAKIERAGGRAAAAQADIADPAGVARLFDTAEAAFGGIDVVV